MKMPHVEGIEVLRELQDFPEAPQVIVMTGFQEVSTAVEAMKLGAYDYLTKPARIEELDILVRKAAEKARLMRQNVVMRAQLDEPGYQRHHHQQPADGGGAAPGRAGGAHRLDGAGAGRERHRQGAGGARDPRPLAPRASRPSCPSTAARSPRELLESELFGHEKGAFTGAVASKPGLIELADGGTLFLDEIGEMEPEIQVKLLRVLERTRSSAWAARGGARSTCAWSPPPTAISRRRSRPAGSARTSSTASTRSRSRCRRCASAARTCAVLVEHFLEQNATYGRKRVSDRGHGGARALRLARQRARAAARGPARGDPLPGRRDPARGPARRDPRRSRAERDRRRQPGGDGAPAHHHHAAPAWAGIARRRPPCSASIPRRSTARSRSTASRPTPTGRPARQSGFIRTSLPHPPCRSTGPTLWS